MLIEYRHDTLLLRCCGYVGLNATILPGIPWGSPQALTDAQREHMARVLEQRMAALDVAPLLSSEQVSVDGILLRARAPLAP